MGGVQRCCGSSSIFFSYFCVDHCLVSFEGQKAQQFSMEKYPLGDPDLKHVRTLQGKRTSPGGLANPC